MAENIQIRLATNEDFDQLLPVWRILSLELPSYHFAPFGDPVPEKLSGQLSVTLKGCLDRGDVQVLVIQGEDEQIIGTLSVVLNQQPTYEKPESAVLFNLWVAEAHRRKGIASELLQSAKMWLKANNVTSVQAGWHPQNSAADHFWKAHGFSSYETIGACLI